MLTKFGTALKKVRFEQNRMTLGELGEKLKLSATFISAMETGRKPVPTDFVPKVVAALKLDAKTARELEAAAIETVKEVSIPIRANPDARARELAVAFARRYETLDPVDISKLMESLTPKEGE